ncbi:macro domain-like protein [Epithele typhae]|uniref:macro domain-like protein n=1 Tax=Epithele typhae TaxID=378194 RepID=UPI002007537B|nr:macro domain-like protein [Epithele typhae]KAH9916949.1 macro domain-like protein [Epithele typhae]
MQAVEFTLFSIDEDLVDEWKGSFQALVPSDLLDHTSFVHASFKEMTTTFDCLVSPANSFGRFDGGFDQILTETLAPLEDQSALTRVAQAVLYERWVGFAPPGTCTLVPLADTPCSANRVGCRYVALCPTMRLPASVSWHKEIVHNCVWSLLVEIDRHNRQAAADASLAPIRSVGMTGFGTGVGGISAKVCARQTALAFAYFHDAKTNPEKWKSLSWRAISDMPLVRRLPMDD